MAAIDKNDDVRSALETALKALDKKEKQSEDTKLQNYLNDSAKTLSGIFYYDDKNESEPDIAFFCDKVIKASKSLDAIKKKKFYNKQINICSSAPSNLKFKRDNTGENVLHAAIGLVTECGEILEEVVRSKYSETPLDVINIKEEIGDITWYLAILLRDLDINLFDAMATNIEKLKLRYPGEKFSTERANNRNLALERTLLEILDPIEHDDKTPHDVLEDKRALPNGGLAPMRSWETKKMNPYLKVDIVSQMRSLYNKGEHAVASNNNTFCVPVNEFTKPFSYLETIKDYNGSFLVNLLKTENDISKYATDLRINIAQDLVACKQNRKVIVSIFDIVGSASQGEEKKFLLTFNFNPLMGTISLSSILFEGGKNKDLTQRQMEELEKFCNVKKIAIM